MDLCCRHIVPQLVKSREFMDEGVGLRQVRAAYVPFLEPLIEPLAERTIGAFPPGGSGSATRCFSYPLPAYLDALLISPCVW